MYVDDVSNKGFRTPDPEFIDGSQSPPLSGDEPKKLNKSTMPPSEHATIEPSFPAFGNSSIAMMTWAESASQN